MFEENKVVIESKKGTTTIRPDSETGEKLTKAIYNIQETGLPSNEDLDSFGDQIITFMKKTKTSDPKSQQLVDKAQKVVENVKSAIQDRNYDEKLQEISKKLKEETISVPVTEKDSEFIVETFQSMGPNLLNLGKIIMMDIEIRKLIVSIIEVFSGATNRAVDRISDRNPNIVEKLKEDVLDVETPGITKTATVLGEAIKDAPSQVEITEDERQHLIRRSIKAFNKIRNKTDYVEFFENLFSLFDHFLVIWYRIKSKPQLFESYSAQIKLFADIREMIERSCGLSLDVWIDTMKRVADITEDKTYINLRRGFEALIIDRESKYRTQEAIEAKIDKIQNEINKLNDKYNQVFRDLLYETQRIFYGFANDPVINQIRSSINDLILEIFVDESGKPSVNAIANSLLRIRDTFFPILKDKITRISLPTLEFDSKKYFFRISDMKIKTSDLIPDQLKIESDFNLAIDLNEMKRKGYFTVRVRLDPFNSDIEGLKFFIKKKSGIKYKDYGTVNIYLRESSLLLELHVRLLKDEVDYIEVSRVQADLSGLKVKIDEAKHDVIDKMVLSIFLPTIKFRLQNMINTALYENLNRGVFDKVNNSLKELTNKKRMMKTEVGFEKEKKLKSKKVDIEVEKEKVPKKKKIEFEVEKEKIPKTKKVDIEVEKEKIPKTKKVDIEVEKEKIPKTKKVDYEEKHVEIEKEKIPKKKKVDIDVENVEDIFGESDLYAKKPTKEMSETITETIIPQELKEAEADIKITERLPPDTGSHKTVKEEKVKEYKVEEKKVNM